MDAPNCECHGEPMVADKKYGRNGSGTYWRCAVKRRASRRRYCRSSLGGACARRYASGVKYQQYLTRREIKKRAERIQLREEMLYGT